MRKKCKPILTISIFAKNPYMADIYPGEEARSALEVFELYEGAGELFDLSCKPIFRQNFVLGNAEMEEHGFYITDECKGCGACFLPCPQNCIVVRDDKVKIDQQHCLHCGKCMEVCPYGAIEKK